MNILSMSLSATFIILAVVAVRAFFIHKLPKKTFMVLWGIAVCRLMIPLSIPFRLNILNILDVMRQALHKKAAVSTAAPFAQAINDAVSVITPERVTDTIVPGVTQTAAPSTAAASAGVGLPWFFYLWLAGFCVFALYFLITHLCCKNVYKTALPVESSYVRQWLYEHPLRRRVYIRKSDRIKAPLTYGILRPVVLLPSSTDWRDETGLSYVLAHEYAHIRRFDTLFKWILAAMLSVHWFNPFAWLMYVFANRDIELSCDETVVRSHGEKVKSLYALTLLGLEEKRGHFMSLCSNFSKNSVEERVVSIMKMKKYSLSSIFTAFILVAGVIMIFATTKAATAVSVESPADYVEKMLFVTQGETALKVTYDGATWAPYSPEDETWAWYSSEEFEKLISRSVADNSGVYQMLSGIYESEGDPAKLRQTLADINNGIKVSKSKTVYSKSGEGPGSALIGPISYFYWYCFGYTFTDQAGNTVDLGLFETRTELFAALKQYYDEEVISGNLTQSEADSLYNKIAHTVRNRDEVPLSDKFTDEDMAFMMILRCGNTNDETI